MGGCSNFVGSESGQKQCSTPEEYGLQHNSTPPAPSKAEPLTVCIHLYFDFGKGGGVGEVKQRKVGGTIVLKAGSKIPTYD